MFVLQNNNQIAPAPGDQPLYCDNVDFEKCNFSDWEISNGMVNNQPYEFINKVITTTFNAGIPINNGLQHSIVSLDGWDPMVPVKTVNASGSCSAVLGDATGTGGKASQLRRVFTITEDNFNFFYSYSVLMQDPSTEHSPGERPFFTIRMFDQNGAPIDCAKYEVYAGDGNPAWKTKSASPDPIVYTGWVEAFIPLQAYIGQNVSIEFTVGDCSLGGHWAYAYVEAHCGAEIMATDTLTCPGIPLTLTAPGGASHYQWSNGATTQSISTSEPGEYTVVLTGTAGGNCTSSISKRIYLKMLQLEVLHRIPFVCIKPLLLPIKALKPQRELKFGSGISTTIIVLKAMYKTLHLY